MLKTIVEIPLNKIKQHAIYDQYAETMVGIDYNLQDPGLLTPLATRTLIDIMPIVVIKHGTRYLYISGRRTYVLAVQNLGIDTTVTTHLATRLTKGQITQYIVADLIFPNLVGGFNRKKYTGKLLQAIKNKSPKTLLAQFGYTTQQQIAAAIGCAKNTIFPPR